ncbi:MAG: RagB/SusD family nutrient uptake outer membrane protein [Flavobacteriaceae bacterium]
MKNLNILTLLFVGILFSSCESDFLEPDLTSRINGSNYFNSSEEIEMAVVNMYDGLQGVNSSSANDNHATQVEFYLTEMRSDNTQTKASEGEAAQFENYTIESNNGIVLDYYRSFYNVIYRANLVLENLTAAADGDRNRFEAEAKFVRAHAYFNLVRLFGQVPLISQVTGPEDTALAYTRAPLADIYTLIKDDLGFAAANLNNSSRTRASRAAAQGLLAKVHLTLGEYSDAKTHLEGVINSDDYSLEADFNDVFYNEDNNETIFAIGYNPGGEDSQNFSSEWLNAVGRTSGVNYVTDDAREALDDFGGSRTIVSYRVDVAQPQFHQVAKFLPSEDFDLTKAGNDWIVLRYADILLMYAEAVIAGQDGTNDARAIDYFNQVRTRAGRPNANGVTKASLLQERRVELAFENHRLFDLIRFGVAQEVLSAFATDTGASFSSTDLLLPIPQREIGLSKGLLTQNPGY